MRKDNAKLTLFLIIFILILSLTPRLWGLTKYPPIIVDEPANLRDINKLLSMPGFHPAEFEWGFGQGTLVFYPTIMLFKLGITDQFLGLRLTSVILSILALIPFFLIVKKQSSTLIAFCTTLIFSFNYYYLQFSRVGWTNIHALTLGLYFLWIVGIQTKYYWLKFFLAGILAGLLLYTYRALEIYFFVGIILLLFQLKVLKVKPFKKFLYLGLFIGSFLSISFPWISKIINNWERYTLREKVVSVLGASYPYHGLTDQISIFIYQIIMSIKSWIFLFPIEGNAGNIENTHYLPLNYPPIMPLIIPLFWFGLAIAIKNWRTTYPWLFIFLVGLLLGQAMTVDPPNGSRALIILPAMYIFISFSLKHLYAKFNNVFYLKLLIILFSIIIAISDFIYYQYWMSWIKV